MDRGLARRAARESLLREAAQLRATRRYERAVRRRERVLARARRAVPLHGTTAAAGAALLLLTNGGDWVFGPVAGVCAFVAARAVVTLRHPPALPAAAPALPPALPPPPPPGSSAWPAVHRLDRVRDELGRLVPLVGPSGRAAAEEAWTAAAEADLALRWQAARLGAVEPHRGAEPALLHTLLEGVACQERLVAATADLVAASDPHLPGASTRLQDATDALHGLADGLRAVRSA